MRIQAFGVELLIDEWAFNELPNGVQKINFVTTLVDLKEDGLPGDIPTIYTSQIVRDQLKVLYLSQKKPLDDAKFHVLKPFEAERIQADNGAVFEVLPCMPVDMSTSIMLVFRDVQSFKITDCYVGFATDLKAIMTNAQFVIWLKKSGDSVENLYRLNLCDSRCVDCEVKEAFEYIQGKLADRQIAKLLVHLPLFGCEAFIAELASRYRGIIAIDGLLCDLFSKLPRAKMQHFIKDSAEAVIVVSTNNLPLAGDCPYEVSKETFKVKWLPLPDAFELNLLIRLVAPKSVKVIRNHKVMQTFEIRLTKYSFEEDEADNSSASNENTTESTICHCSQIKTPFQLAPVNHSDIMDCMRHLTIAFTTMPSAKNTPERKIATAVPEAKQMHISGSNSSASGMIASTDYDHVFKEESTVEELMERSFNSTSRSTENTIGSCSQSTSLSSSTASQITVISAKLTEKDEFKNNKTVPLNKSTTEKTTVAIEPVIANSNSAKRFILERFFDGPSTSNDACPNMERNDLSDQSNKQTTYSKYGTSNVHRLSDKRKDSDDGNATSNSNSTQQQ